MRYLVFSLALSLSLFCHAEEQESVEQTYQQPAYQEQSTGRKFMHAIGTALQGAGQGLQNQDKYKDDNTRIKSPKLCTLRNMGTGTYQGECQ